VKLITLGIVLELFPSTKKMLAKLFVYVGAKQ
jgi:hypothetical protein